MGPKSTFWGISQVFSNTILIFFLVPPHVIANLFYFWCKNFYYWIFFRFFRQLPFWPHNWCWCSVLTFQLPTHSIRSGELTVISIKVPLGQLLVMGAIEMSRHTSCTYPDTPNQKCPDNSNRKCSDTFCVSWYFLLGNRKYPDSPTGNIPTVKKAFWVSGYFLLGNRKCPDR
jgi:hypothetical protein